jgi:hypothetical protein
LALRLTRTKPEYKPAQVARCVDLLLLQTNRTT